MIFVSLTNGKFSASEFIFLLLKLLAQTGIYKFHTRGFENALFGLKKNIGSLELTILMSEMDFYYRNGQYFCDEADAAFTELQNSDIIAFENPKFVGFVYLGDKIKKNRKERAEYITKVILKNLKKLDLACPFNVSQFLRLTVMFLNLYGQEMEKLKMDEFSRHHCREFIAHWDHR